MQNSQVADHLFLIFCLALSLSLLLLVLWDDDLSTNQKKREKVVKIYQLQVKKKRHTQHQSLNELLEYDEDERSFIVCQLRYERPRSKMDV